MTLLIKDIAESLFLPSKSFIPPVNLAEFLVCFIPLNLSRHLVDQIILADQVTKDTNITLVLSYILVACQ